METTATTSTPIHPLAWVAGTAVILFSAVGIGALMGWIPNSIGGPGEKPIPLIAAPAPHALTPAPRLHVAAAPVAAPRPAPAQVAAGCIDCGTIESVREIDTKGAGTGLGAVGGAVVGGLLGSQIGGGRGQDVMTVVGAVGGGFAGNEVEKRVKSTRSYSVTVRLQDGSSRAFSEAALPAWHVGDKVRIVDGAIRSNG